MTNVLDRIAMIAECDGVVVNTYGIDGNAMSIIGACTLAMRRAGISKKIQMAFFKEATAGNYENVLKTADTWVKLVHIVPAPGHDSFISGLRKYGISPEPSPDNEE